MVFPLPSLNGLRTIKERDWDIFLVNIICATIECAIEDENVLSFSLARLSSCDDDDEKKSQQDMKMWTNLWLKIDWLFLLFVLFS